VTFAICFDFPEAPGEPLFAGWAGDAPGFAPTLATAMRFDDWDVAERFLANSYGPSIGECGAVVEVAELMSAFSEREPQSLTVTPHADGARPELGSGGPSRSESADPPAAVVRAGLEAPTQWGDDEWYLPVPGPDTRRLP
jgi:hypothetical protein